MGILLLKLGGFAHLALRFAEKRKVKWCKTQGKMVLNAG